MRWRVSMVDGSSMVQNQKLRCSTSAGRTSHPSAVARAVDDVVEPVEQHRDPADAALAHRDLERRVLHRVLRPQPLGARVQRQLAEQRGAELEARARPAGTSRQPELPTCSETTVSVSTHASMIGSQWSRPRDRREADQVRALGQLTAVNPRSALRRISAAATLGVGEVRDAERDDPRRGARGTTPRTASRSTRGCTPSRARGRRR